jgi:hypothetical protein
MLAVTGSKLINHQLESLVTHTLLTDPVTGRISARLPAIFSEEQNLEQDTHDYP